jgi:hypothetical protein
MQLLLLASTLALSACATPRVISSTPAGGIVSGADWKHGAALQTANAECQKYGKVARPGSRNIEGNMTFDCVAP